MLAGICILAAVVLFFHFAERYVKSARPPKAGHIELVDVPQWATEQLKARIRAAASDETFTLDENAARLVAENLASVGWLDKVQVRTTHDRLLIKARWRRPLALVKSGLSRCYVDADLVVLDYVPLAGLPIVKVKALAPTAEMPPAGQAWQQKDLAAAVAILDRLDRMDKLVAPDNPLLYEINSIDVSNFDGRQDAQAAHIILYTKDNTEIIWGAEIGTWQRHLEATDQEKLAKLYGYYKEYGSLLGGVKYINLRNPQETVPRPADRY